MSGTFARACSTPAITAPHSCHGNIATISSCSTSEIPFPHFFPHHFLIKEILRKLQVTVSERGGQEGGSLVEPLVRLFINYVSLW